MTPCFFELRKQSARGTDSLAADIMRHLHTRQYLGKTVVVCEQPYAVFCAARKQWLKLARSIQKQRAGTLNADKILKYTHTITHMQHLRFTIKTPLEEPGADVYFLGVDELHAFPSQCYTMYVTAPVAAASLRHYTQQLAADALIVDYTPATDYDALGLLPKHALETRVADEWNMLDIFLQQRDIHIGILMSGTGQNINAMDDALDTLLDVSRNFLQLANDFQRALELARPLRLGKDIRQQYDSLVLLAYRVQSLMPGAFSKRFLETYNEDDTFFLYDAVKDYLLGSGESLAEATARHTQAGRHRLAQALGNVAHWYHLARHQMSY